MDEHIEIDDRFVGDWVEYGLAQLEAYLAKQARFDEYCDRREAHPRIARRRTGSGSACLRRAPLGRGMPAAIQASISRNSSSTSSACGTLRSTSPCA